jgi:phosphate ABC transporter phosphate-binding protein
MTARDSKRTLKWMGWKWKFALACFALTVPAFAGQATEGAARRLYVEPFATKADAEKLREDLIAELRKSSSVALASDAAHADLILGGGGEIWVRGYRSFSPRSEMKLATNGTPIYGGYLSVELKDTRGITIWSYLATPAADSTDISKDLAKRIARHLAEALRRPEMLAPSVPDPPSTVALHGAGATFPYPVYRKWITNYRMGNPGVGIDYDAIGSQEGIRKLLAREVDFGASDSPEVIRELAPADDANFVFLPSVVGAVVPIVNLPGVAETISFTPEALAGIYLGKIRKWNDPAIARSNRGVHLPDLDIVAVHRADGSGTSYAFTSFLSKSSADWNSAVGSGLTPKWPVGRAATGNDGVAKLVKELGGSIGYVEFIYALENHLSFGSVRNQNGEFVQASLESIASAVNHSSDVLDGNVRPSIVDAPGEGAYPIASFTWLVVPTRIADDGKRSAVAAFLKWILGPGQRQAAALGYLALPKEIVAKEQDVIAQIH